MMTSSPNESRETKELRSSSRVVLIDLSDEKPKITIEDREEATPSRSGRTTLLDLATSGVIRPSGRSKRTILVNLGARNAQAQELVSTGTNALELLESHQDMIRGFVARRVPSQDVDDIVQKIAQAVLEAFPGFRGESAPSTWLYSVCRFTVFGHHRENKTERIRRSRLQEKIRMEPDSRGEREDPVVQEERAEVVQNLLDGLPTKQREVLELRFFQGQSFPEIARELEVNSDEAARSRCRRALRTAEQRLPKGRELL